MIFGHWLLHMTDFDSKADWQAEYFCTKDAARYTGLSRQWFEQARVRGDGPPYCKVTRAVRYKRSELDEWMLARQSRHIIVIYSWIDGCTLIRNLKTEMDE